MPAPRLLSVHVVLRQSFFFLDGVWEAPKAKGSATADGGDAVATGRRPTGCAEGSWKASVCGGRLTVEQLELARERRVLGRLPFHHCKCRVTKLSGFHAEFERTENGVNRSSVPRTDSKDTQTAYAHKKTRFCLPFFKRRREKGRDGWGGTLKDRSDNPAADNGDQRPALLRGHQHRRLAAASAPVASVALRAPFPIVAAPALLSPSAGGARV